MPHEAAQDCSGFSQLTLPFSSLQIAIALEGKRQRQERENQAAARSSALPRAAAKAAWELGSRII